MSNPSPQPEPKPELQSRRAMLLQWAQWLAVGAVALFLYPLSRFISFTMPKKPRLVEIASPLPLSGVHSAEAFILFVDKDGARALSRTCTHLGCRINYQEDKGYIECPCHQSRFSSTGQRLSGPAKKDLPVYPVSLKKDGNDEVIAYVVQM